MNIGAVDVDLADLRGDRPRLVPPASPGLLVADLSPADLVDLFSDRLRSIDANVGGPMPVAEAPAAVAEIFTGYKVSAYLGWEHPLLRSCHSGLSRLGIRRLDALVPESGPARVRHLQGLGEAQGGLTSADAGLAESGSIVLRSGPGRPRSASLLPPLHVALLTVSRLVRTLSHYAAQHPAAADGISNLVVITGPSRTGDIEQELTLGVHGPRYLHVVLVN